MLRPLRNEASHVLWSPPVINSEKSKSTFNPRTFQSEVFLRENGSKHWAHRACPASWQMSPVHTALLPGVLSETRYHKASLALAVPGSSMVLDTWKTHEAYETEPQSMLGFCFQSLGFLFLHNSVVFLLLFCFLSFTVTNINHSLPSSFYLPALILTSSLPPGFIAPKSKKNEAVLTHTHIYI